MTRARDFFRLMPDRRESLWLFAAGLAIATLAIAALTLTSSPIDPSPSAGLVHSTPGAPG